jgi:hypothetical protein
MKNCPNYCSFVNLVLDGMFYLFTLFCIALIAFNGRSTNTERSHTMEINAAGSPGVECNTQAFLETLAAGGGKPIEQLSPTDARAVLADVQAGVKLDLPKADIAEKTVSVDGENVDLTVVRPAGAKEVLPVFMFFHVSSSSRKSRCATRKSAWARECGHLPRSLAPSAGGTARQSPCVLITIQPHLARRFDEMAWPGQVPLRGQPVSLA